MGSSPVLRSSDVIKSSTRSSLVTSSTVLRRVELVLKVCTYQYAFGSYTCNFCIVRSSETSNFSVAFYPTDFTANFRIFPPKFGRYYNQIPPFLLPHVALDVRG